MATDEKLIYDLAAIGMVRLGAASTVATQATQPVTIDQRPLVAHPHVLRRAAHSMAEVIENLDFQRIAVMTGTNLPLGTAIALELTRPLIFSCKDPLPDDDPGIEGLYSRGDTVIYVAGVLRDGHGSIESIHRLEAVGLHVKDVVVLIDREEGGVDALRRNGYQLHSVCKVSEVVEALRRRKSTGSIPAVSAAGVQQPNS